MSSLKSYSDKIPLHENIAPHQKPQLNTSTALRLKLFHTLQTKTNRMVLVYWKLETNLKKANHSYASVLLHGFLRHSYAFTRFLYCVSEIVGAMISVFAIWVVTGVLVYLAVMRLINKDYKVDGETMLITASLAVGFNIMYVDECFLLHLCV